MPGRGQSQADIQKVLCPEGDSHRQTYRKFCARKGTVTGRHTESSVPRRGQPQADIQKVPRLALAPRFSSQDFIMTAIAVLR